jgi:ABC-type branched-subunit amino acid transport system permease subunit
MCCTWWLPALVAALCHVVQRSAPWPRWPEPVILALLIAFALALPWLSIGDRNTVDRATLILIYVVLGTGLSIVVGLAGLLDLGYVAFYAVGAYSYALLSQHFGLNFWECLPLAGILAAGFGLMLGFPVLRLRGDYLAIVTLGFGEMVHVVLVNWTPVTGGANGISVFRVPIFSVCRSRPLRLMVVRRLRSISMCRSRRCIGFIFSTI